MRLNIKGVSLIELLIAVILISTLATAYMNFHNNFGEAPDSKSALSPVDSARYAILDEIAMDIRLARSGPYEKSAPFTIERQRGGDKLKIRHNNFYTEFLVDEQGRLIRQTGNSRKVVESGIVSLKARVMGEETVVLTISTILPGETGNMGNVLHSYSKVVTVNFPLQFGRGSADRADR